MAEQLILAESYGEALADEDVPCVIIRLFGFTSGPQIQQFSTAALDYYKAHSRPERPWGWLADARHLSAIPQKTQQWLQEVWNVAAYQAGIREISIVVAANVQGQLATQQYSQHLQTTPQLVIEPAYYASLDEAKRGAARRCAALRAPGQTPQK